MAEVYGWDPTLVRIGWVLATILGGVGLVVYIVLWIVTPPYSRVFGGQQSSDHHLLRGAPDLGEAARRGLHPRR